MERRKYSSFYDVLGVANSASADEIRKAYRKRALETHPDKLDPGAREEEKQAAESQFHKVHEAFENLGDAQKRRTYDSRLAMKADPYTMSEETARRMADRFQWALRQRDQHQKRMEAIKHEKERKQLVQAAMTGEAKLVAEMLQELYEMNPELAERRKAVLQRKHEREREKAALRSQSFPVRS